MYNIIATFFSLKTMQSCRIISYSIQKLALKVIIIFVKPFNDTVKNSGKFPFDFIMHPLCFCKTLFLNGTHVKNSDKLLIFLMHLIMPLLLLIKESGSFSHYMDSIHRKDKTIHPRIPSPQEFLLPITTLEVFFFLFLDR